MKRDKDIPHAFHRNERKIVKENLTFVYNLNSKQSLIHALVIPKGLLSVAITNATTALCT